MDNGPQGAYAASPVQNGVQFLQGKGNTHAKAGCFGPDNIHAKNLWDFFRISGGCPIIVSRRKKLDTFAL
jgi:hypothetical protein